MPRRKSPPARLPWFLGGPLGLPPGRLEEFTDKVRELGYELVHNADDPDAARRARKVLGRALAKKGPDAVRRVLEEALAKAKAKDEAKASSTATGGARMGRPSQTPPSERQRR